MKKKRLYVCYICQQRSTVDEMNELDIYFVHNECWKAYRKIVLQGGDEDKWLKKWRRKAKTKH
jgi:hypothetical protein